MNTFVEYCEKLKDKIFILLPIFEGKDYITREIIYPRDKAYNDFLKSLDKLKIEIRGCVNNYSDIVEFVEMCNIIEGLKSITKDEKELLRKHVFNLMNICEKIQSNYKN